MAAEFLGKVWKTVGYPGNSVSRGAVWTLAVQHQRNGHAIKQLLFWHRQALLRIMPRKLDTLSEQHGTVL